MGLVLNLLRPDPGRSIGSTLVHTFRRDGRKTLTMAPRSIIDEAGRIVHESDPDFNHVRLDRLERELGDLVRAVSDIQHRLTKLDGEPLQWPGDTYEPTDTTPG